MSREGRRVAVCKFRDRDPPARPGDIEDEDEHEEEDEHEDEDERPVGGGRRAGRQHVGDGRRFAVLFSFARQPALDTSTVTLYLPQQLEAPTVR